jgi:hypothetical protein
VWRTLHIVFMYVLRTERKKMASENGIRQCMLKIFCWRRIVTGQNVLGTEYQRTECAGDGLSENGMYRDGPKRM